MTLREVSGSAELSVTDTGTGIPEDEVPHVFERFRRVRDARSRTFEGSGIGLSLVQELASIHGGEVSVESVYGAGLDVPRTHPAQAHLPAERIGAPRTLASTAMGAAPFVEEALRWLPDASPRGDIGPVSRGQDDSDRRPSAATVLVADDNADMREYVTRLLARRWNVDLGTTGTRPCMSPRRATSTSCCPT